MCIVRNASIPPQVGICRSNPVNINGIKQANPLLIGGENGAINWNCCSAMQMVIFSFPEQAYEHFCVWEYFLILFSCVAVLICDSCLGWRVKLNALGVSCVSWAIWGDTTLLILYYIRGASDLWVMDWLKLHSADVWDCTPSSFSCCPEAIPPSKYFMASWSSCIAWG